MTDLSDFAESDKGPQVAESRFLAMKAKRDSYKRELGRKEAELERALAAADLLATIDDTPVRAPKWGRAKSKKGNRGTAMLLLSDWHFDEVVDPTQLVGSKGEPLNAFNRDIAERRLRTTFENTVHVAADLMGGFDYDGIVLQLGGDLVSGNIHEELVETNESTVIATVDHFVDHLAAGIDLLAERFGSVHIPVVVGNHGRNTRKPRAKNRVMDNFDWLIARMLVRHFRSDKRVTWNVPNTADAYWEVYGHLHLLTHGDQARGGAGIAGLATPLALFDHRKRKRDSAAGAAASHTWMGHWHTYTQMAGLTVNGAGKGYDEYAFINNFGLEPPMQAFAVITPEHNVTVQAPIYCEDRAAEGW